MAYEKTTWKDRAVERPRTFTIQNNPDGTITLIPAPGVIVEEGTTVNAVNMNKIENGIEVAHKQIKIKRNIVIFSSNWVDDTANSGFWVYEISDVDIDENTMVDINIDLNDIEKASSIKSVTDSFEGYVRMYADEQPKEDITADLKLARQV